MEYDTETPPYATSDQTSFAYVSARDRWPVILTGAIDDLHRAIAACNDDEKIADGKTIVEGLTTLKYELQHNRPLTPLTDDARQDVADYNRDLNALGSPTWFNVPWLYAECYLYRRMSTFFALSAHWKSYDVFARQKLSTFISSRPAVLELAAKYKQLINQLQSNVPSSKSPEEIGDAEKLLFSEMCEICLWGNATDLSLLTALTYDDIQKLQGAEARKVQEKNILVNDLPAAYRTLKATQNTEPKGERRVDIILDNAGFELFVDLILAGYLLAAGLATQIVLHPKSIPWFVSDVLPADFASLLNALADPQALYAASSDKNKDHDGAPTPLSGREVSELSFLFEHWSRLHQEGQLTIRPNLFWTGPGSYWRLPSSAPNLAQDLRESELVIFKGDLNYRKLAGDAMWPTTVPFTHALGPMGPGSGIRTLALRTCKADTVVGLPAGQDERLKSLEGGGGDTGARKWAWSGKWAVVQFCDGKA
ncbi:MAG: hypothetical protein L6R36_007680 [Xanthoria steineri]|nr:MAG: hypothetical protein L6R36_007680 [Xanthoria steineri]